MKKISYLCLVILGILITITIVNEFNEIYYFNMSGFKLVSSQLNREGVYSDISANELGISMGELVDRLMDFAQNNNIDLVACRQRNDDLNRTNVEYYIYSTEYNIGDDLFVDGDNVIKFNSKSERNYYTTNVEEQDENSIKLISNKYRDGFRYNFISFRPFYQYKDVYAKEDVLLDMGFYGENLDEVIELLNKEFGIVEKNLAVMILEDRDNYTLKKCLKFCGVALALLLLLFICEVISRIKEINIRKMQGQSIIKIEYTMFGKFFLKCICLLFLSLVMSYTLNVREVSLMSLSIIKEMIKIFFIFLIGYIIIIASLFYVIKLAISYTNLKNDDINYKLIRLNLFLKLILMILIIVPFMSITTNMAQVYNNFKNIATNHDFDTYRYGITNLMYLKDDVQLEKNKKKIYEVIDSNGGYYMECNNIYNDEVFNNIDVNDKNYMPYIIVNKNYLKNYNIEIFNGEKLDIDQIETNLILVPERYDYNDFVNINKQFCNSNFEHEALIIKNELDFYNPAITHSNRYINNPIIVVMESYSLPIRIEYPSLYFSDDSLIRTAFEKEKVTGLCYIYDSNVWKLHYMNIYLKELAMSLIVIIIYTLVICMLAFQNTCFYINEYKKIISIKYLMGYNIKKIYINLICINIIPYIMMPLIGRYFLKLPYVYISVFCLIYMFVEGIFIIYIMSKFKRNVIVTALKGK